MRMLLAIAAFLVATAAISSLPGAFAQTGEALIRVDPPPEPVPSGSEFDVNLVVDDVANLAAFQVTLRFDPEMMAYQKIEQGPFLGSSGRDVLCQDPVVGTGSVGISCVTTSPPVSVGGPEGPSGSGLLAAVTFSPSQSGEAELELSNVILVLDDLDPDGQTIEIPSRTQNGAVELLGGGGGFNWVLWAPIIAGGAVVVLAAVVAAGALGFGPARRARPGEGGPMGT